MVSLFGRGFDSLQLHYVTPSRGLTLVRVLSVATLCKSGKADDWLKKTGGSLKFFASLLFSSYLCSLKIKQLVK